MQRQILSTYRSFSDAERARNLYLNTNLDLFPDHDPDRKVVQIRRRAKGIRFDVVIRS